MYEYVHKITIIFLICALVSTNVKNLHGVPLSSTGQKGSETRRENPTDESPTRVDFSSLLSRSPDSPVISTLSTPSIGSSDELDEQHIHELAEWVLQDLSIETNQDVERESGGCSKETPMSPFGKVRSKDEPVRKSNKSFEHFYEPTRANIDQQYQQQSQIGTSTSRRNQFEVPSSLRQEEVPSAVASDVSWAQNASSWSQQISGNATDSSRSSETSHSVDKNTILIVPKVRGTKIDVSAQMKREHFDPSLFSIKQVTAFPSGAVLLQLESEQEAEYIRKTVAKSEILMVKSRKVHRREVRIHEVPQECTESEISKLVRLRFDESPSSVYFRRISGKKFTKLAIIIAESRLLQRMEASPTILIRGHWYVIDMSIRIQRCNNCQLLGHSQRQCDDPQRPPISPDEPCVDCCYYNKYITKANLDQSKLRDVNHPTNDESCLSRMYYIKKWERHHQQLEETVEEGNDGSQVSPSGGVDEGTTQQGARSAQEREVNEKTTTDKVDVCPMKDGEKIPEETLFIDYNELYTPVLNKTNVLVVPKVFGSNLNIFKELQKLDFDFASLRIKNSYVYQSGYVLFQFESEREAREFENEISTLENLAVGSSYIHPRQVRIHDVPEESTESELAFSIYLRHKECPDKIEFVLYRDSWIRRVKMAVLNVGSSLLKKMEESSDTIQIRGRSLKIDTTVKVPRCSNCRLLGHKSKHCRGIQQPPFFPNEPCRDCHHYNQMLIKHRFDLTKWRNIYHPTGDKKCPTRKYYETKWGSLYPTEEAAGKDRNIGLPRSGEKRERTVSDPVEKTVNRFNENRVAFLILPLGEGTDAQTEFKSLDLDDEACEIESVTPYPSGAILVECASEKGAARLQEAIALSDKLEIDTIIQKPVI